MHQTIKKVSNDFENLKYNTAIAAMMALINDFYKEGFRNKGRIQDILYIIKSGCTTYHRRNCGTGLRGRLYPDSWPEFDEAKTVESTSRLRFRSTARQKQL